MPARIFVKALQVLSINERRRMRTANAQSDPDKLAAAPAPIIIANDRNTFIKHRGPREPANLARRSFLKWCPLQVIDAESLKLVQVLQLHKTIDHTASATGSAVLLRSLVRPSTDLLHLHTKQEALREIASNDHLRNTLNDFVHAYGTIESVLFKFFNKGLYAMFPYADVQRARRSTDRLFKQSLPKAESPYLRDLISRLHAFRESSVAQLLNGTIYKTFRGLQSAKEVGLFTPKLKFTAGRFTKWIFAGPAIALAPYVQTQLGFGPSLSPLMTSIGIGLTGLGLFYSLFVKPVRDTGKFIEPLRKRCVHAETFSQAIDAIGMIDELLAVHSFAKELPHATILPEITDDAHHAFEATGLKNPVLSKENEAFVPNDIHMNGARLTFISGPNSGGKTTLCKSIIHNQLLAQMGAYVVAEKAKINIADRICYQAPKFDGLQDDEGRFGTELSRTRDIFYATGPKSLVILDELAEGTTYEERLDASFGILSDFHTIGNNTILVTHNHSLVDRFMDVHKGQCLMAEFIGGAPTYKVVPGISRKAHADRIVKKIKFSQADRHAYMKNKGYL